MARSRTVFAAAVVVVVVATAGACGLISSDVTDFKLRFPQHDFRVDTADWNLSGTGTVPAVACSTNQCGTLCTSGTGTTSCTGDCNTNTNTCQAHIHVQLTNDYNLAVEAPEYAEIASHPVVNVTVDTVWFQITSNTLNVATPALQIWIGPATVASPADPKAKLVGSIRSIPAHATGMVTVDLGPDGNASLKSFMDDFHTPFRILVVGTIDVHAGDPVPMGQLVGYVQATAHAGL